MHTDNREDDMTVQKRLAQHAIEIPLTLSTARLHDAAQLFLNFLEYVPDVAKRTVHFKSPYPRGSASGYSDVRGILGKDAKEYVHYNQLLLNHPEYQALMQNYPEAQAFFAEADSIYRASVHMARELFTKHETLSPFYSTCFDEDGNTPNAHLRFLCYTPSPGAFRAKGHYDKGIGTILLAESCPGLRLGCCDKHALTPAIRSGGMTLFMPGHLLWEESQGTITPTWHDVAQLPDTEPVNARCARWAIVFFINHKDGRYPSWDDVHTPLPVHKPWRGVR